jgi:hypothetical protein
MSKRKAISKRVRFSVFARDNFTCVYCGEQPPAVVLNLEHVIPVCKGGTDDEANLRTACWDCNAGKGDKEIGETIPIDADGFRQAQELAEQQMKAQQLADAIQARKDYRQQVVNLWCNALGLKQSSNRTISTIVNLIDEFDAVTVCEWIEIAAAKCYYDDTDAIKYVCGIARKRREADANA